MAIGRLVTWRGRGKPGLAEGFKHWHLVKFETNGQLWILGILAREQTTTGYNN